MANPITWRNISSTVSGNVSPLLSGAGVSLNRAFDRFTDAANGVTDMRQKEHDHKVKTNTEALRDMLSSYDTPQALAEAQPEINNFISGLNGVVDKNVARNGVNDRTKELRDSILASQKFDDQQTAINNRPALDEAVNLIIGGKTDELNNLVQETPFLNKVKTYRDFMGLANTVSSTNRTKTLQEREDLAYEESQDSKLVDKAIDNQTKNSPDFIETSGLNTLSRLSDFMSDKGIANLNEFNALPDAQKQSLADSILNSDISPKTHTQLIREFTNDLRKNNPKATSAQIEAGKSAFSEMLSGHNQLHPSDEALLAQQKVQLARQANIDPAWLDEQPVKAEEEWARISSKYSDLWQEIGIGDTNSFRDRFLEATTKGIIVDPNKPDIRVKLPPAMVELLIQEIEPGWLVDNLPEKGRAAELIKALTDRAINIQTVRDQIDGIRSGMLAKSNQDSHYYRTQQLYKALTAYGSKD